ncbi:MAG TPA: hypothetical protein VL754_11565 [Verrucomicrobiae bacterium]|jgi:YD repeat-containing protein|nr:hypothetical protein [Verrucomicrobiae bacterium]
MKLRWLISFFVLATLAMSSPVKAAKAPQFPQDVSFTTLQDAANPGHSLLLPFAIEGLTGDANGNLYTTGRQLDSTKKCPVWKFSLSGLNATRTTIGFIPNGAAPAACNPSGITFDAVGNLYIADNATISGVQGFIWKVTPDPTGCASDDSTVCTTLAVSSTPSTPYARAVPGANGLAFDRSGNVWTGDGVTGQGRVWKIGSGGGDCTPPTPTNCAEVFRIQPMAATNLEIGLAFSGGTFGSSVTSVGRDARTLPPGTIDAARADNNNPAGTSQPLVANGIAFNHQGDLLVEDDARGAIWRVQFDRAGNLTSPTGCDDVFTDNTLCLSNVFIAHPIIEGADGMVLDVAGNIWLDANERNAVAIVTKDGRIIEIFRNPPNPETHLRNKADISTDTAAQAAEKNSHILEFPTSPFLSGGRFCTAQSDGNRRDNSPRTDGEINAGTALASPDPGKRGKISCMTDPDSGNLIQVNIPGLPLPVH